MLERLEVVDREQECARDERMEQVGNQLRG
jgi:hypothetical protein